jgi:hypothetical protein
VDETTPPTICQSSRQRAGVACGAGPAGAGWLWCYLYRAIDRDGNPCRHDAQRKPGHEGGPSALPLGQGDHRLHAGPGDERRAWLLSKGNSVDPGPEGPAPDERRLEQNHRGIKGCIRYMRSFKDQDAAERFCREDDELRDFLRARPITINASQHIAAATASSSTPES